MKYSTLGPNQSAVRHHSGHIHWVETHEPTPVEVHSGRSGSLHHAFLGCSATTSPEAAMFPGLGGQLCRRKPTTISHVQDVRGSFQVTDNGHRNLPQRVRRGCSIYLCAFHRCIRQQHRVLQRSTPALEHVVRNDHLLEIGQHPWDCTRCQHPFGHVCTRETIRPRHLERQ